MKTFIIGYFNWYDEVVQFTEIVAESRLEALRKMCLPKFSLLKTEEEICQAEIKRGGFLGYMEK